MTDLYAKKSLIGGRIDSYIARGISAVDSDQITIRGNTVSGAIGEGIYIENIGSSPGNLIANNTVDDIRVDQDTNLEAAIFVRNNRDGSIKITGNTVADFNQTEGQGFPQGESSNGSDGIELNICRGGIHTSNHSAFSDDQLKLHEKTTLTAIISSNLFDNLQGTTDELISTLETMAS